ncbi:TPA: tyrosine-protein kinase, partial [Escherichia coli]|nr:tyrosine-protein kinase [Escherichia coli]
MSLEKNKQDVKDNEEIDLGRLIGEIIDHRKIIISITA